MNDTVFDLKAPRTVRLVKKAGRYISLRDGNLGELIIEGANIDLDDTKEELLRLGRCQRQGCGKLFYK